MKTITDHVMKAVEELLEIEAMHSRRIWDMERVSGMEMDKLQIDLLDVALDLLGVPPDNTIQQEEKYGHQGMLKRDDTFCRDLFCERWSEIVDSGNTEEVAAFPRWVIAKMDNSLN